MGGLNLAITVDPLASQLGGIGRYTLELCRGLAHRADVSSLFYYRNGRWISDPLALLDDVEIVRRDPSNPLARLYEKWSNRRQREQTIFHGTNFFLPVEARRGVITVHDLSVIRFPELHPAARIRAYEKEFAGSVARANHIITPTQVMREEVIDYLGCSPSRVSNVALAASPHYRPRLAREIADDLANWNLQYASFGLSVATIEPRKKLLECLAAWEVLPRTIRDHFPLVIVGGDGWENRTIRDRIRSGVDEGWVRNLGYVSEDKLPILFAAAALVLYPSVYEGFGLPAVEAMASGVPVLVSGKSCLVEVTQGAAMMVDPDDTSEFARQIEKALTDESWRDAAAAAGIKVAATYSWRRCVDRTVEIYHKVASGN